MYTVFFQTFGCKVNQAETASLARKFCQKKYKVVKNYSEADVIFINTCTVTHRSDAKCRQAIRKFHHHNPRATIIVAGCYAQVCSEDISNIKGVDYMFGLQDKFKLFDYFKKPGKMNIPCIVVNPVTNINQALSTQGYFPHRTRALVKIQDGCNQKCSYCIVPYTRGRARSVKEDEVLNQITRLIDQGFKEIVLTGVHIGKYGKDRQEKDSLAKLLEKIITIPHLGRIRLSSIDAVDISDRLMSIVADSEKICNHFHIPLQSGSDEILRLMNRNYTVKQYIDKIDLLLSNFNMIGLGTDVITGFPGESDAEFNDTYNVISKIPFTYLHVFPFSLRKLTRAYSMSERINPAVSMKRAGKLRKLGAEKKKTFRAQWIDKKVKVLFENQNKNGKIKGLSSEYIPIRVDFQNELINKFALVKIDKMEKNYLKATVIKKI
ncbi:MAG: tRNA (N(6)-L-threonylcarbamoyladenosine(37)-C(2))-methylthiotransferase MtaB [bacterium]